MVNNLDTISSVCEMVHIVEGYKRFLRCVLFMPDCLVSLKFALVVLQ